MRYERKEKVIIILEKEWRYFKQFLILHSKLLIYEPLPEM
jgi:hypothetical protein